MPCVHIHAVVIHHSPIVLPAARADHIEQFEDASMNDNFFAADERDDDETDWRESMSIELQVCFLRFMYLTDYSLQQVAEQLCNVPVDCRPLIEQAVKQLKRAIKGRVAEPTAITTREEPTIGRPTPPLPQRMNDVCFLLPDGVVIMSRNLANDDTERAKETTISIASTTTRR